MTRWVLLSLLGTGSVIAACGGDDANGRLADAPTAIDATVPIDVRIDDGDPPIPPVTVTVTLGGLPAPGVTVYFQNRTSDVVVIQPTDSYGDARGSVEPGGFVTVIEPTPPPPGVIAGSTRLTTFAAVQPDDHLYVDVPGGGGNPVVATITVRVPNEGLGYSYHLFTTCGDGDIGVGNGELRARAGKRVRAPLTATVENTVELANCGASADMLAVGTDSDDLVRSWGYLPAQPVVDQGTVELAQWSAAADRTFSFTLASGGAVDFERTLYTARGPLFRKSFTAGAEGGTASTTIALPVPEGVNAVTRVDDFPSNGYGQDHVVDWGANDDYTLDFPAAALHDFTAPPQLDPPTHALTWSEAADGKQPDFMTGIYTNTRSDQEVSHTWTWRIVGPYRAGTLAYPVLPTTEFDFNPHAGDSIDSASIRAVQIPGGYRAARASRIFSGDDVANLDAGITGATGRIVFETVQFLSPAEHRLTPTRKNPATLRRGRFTRHAR